MFTAAFLAEDRDHWVELFAGTEACVTAVLAPEEVVVHPPIVARGTLLELDGVWQAAPAPRFSRTPPATPSAPAAPGSSTASVRQDWLE
ncbi:hypothetical protein AB0P21_18575 [Kribbella sp. NPDC056861]|uniref:hypothetical protein n=1 Tax=Kribbella sp. NPDC056861 TaxID=3154857 RepID=UPI0034153161